MKTSPPDANGYMSFGSSVWTNRVTCNIARHIICEVDESLIRTYGENFLHVSEVDLLVEARPGQGETAESIPPRAPGTVEAAEVICTLIASELIKDGDTIQIGLGDVTTAMALYLWDKHDLGIQTELISHFVPRQDFEPQLVAYYSPPKPGKMWKADDMAKSIAFLASDDARMINGAVLVCDGGTLA